MTYLYDGAISLEKGFGVLSNTGELLGVNDGVVSSLNVSYEKGFSASDRISSLAMGEIIQPEKIIASNDKLIISIDKNKNSIIALIDNEWSSVFVSSDYIWKNILSNGKIFFLVGIKNTEKSIHISIDGVSWRRLIMEGNYNFFIVKNKFYIIKKDKLLVSGDGWKWVEYIVNKNLMSGIFSYFNGKYFSMNYLNKINISTDLTNWETYDTNVEHKHGVLMAESFNGNTLIISECGSIYISSNLLSWDRIDFYESPYIALYVLKSDEGYIVLGDLLDKHMHDKKYEITNFILKIKDIDDYEFSTHHVRHQKNLNFNEN